MHEVGFSQSRRHDQGDSGHVCLVCQQRYLTPLVPSFSRVEIFMRNMVNEERQVLSTDMVEPIKPLGGPSVPTSDLVFPLTAAAPKC